MTIVPGSGIILKAKKIDQTASPKFFLMLPLDSHQRPSVKSKVPTSYLVPEISFLTLSPTLVPSILNFHMMSPLR